MPTKKKTVTDFIVRSTLETIGESASIQEAAIKMKDTKVSSLLVVGVNTNGQNIPKGIVTERDLVRKVCINDIHTAAVTIQEIESYPLITIDHNASPSEAIDMMLEKNVRHLLVVDNEKTNNTNKLVGIITPLDFVRYPGDGDDADENNVTTKIHRILEYYR